ncbi:uncharacterized protein N7496_000103 [Penicillium cataractarum]|uniref:Uncharacterized protein n=1 Tax=Penicillium cataractarum TaxID=2100454 RepID=A0A9W9VTR5_9EURO|nr:uncharacterized protein N7496_000103 [Penicillium cataractarum]KAJ5389035.1 hypothetical protein N7496_000103 [Penicillium cataractarum]
MTSAIDETPLSAFPHERRNSLEKHLQTRPDMQDLKNRHILLNTNVAPSLQSAQQELDRQRATDSLKKNLEKRPERDELVERISPRSFCCLSDSTVYTCVTHAVFMPLTRYYPRTLSSAVILTRQGNILPASTAAPALQAHARELERHMLADNLEHKIQNRPEPEALITQGILTEDEDPRSA